MLTNTQFEATHVQVPAGSWIIHAKVNLQATGVGGGAANCRLEVTRGTNTLPNGSDLDISRFVNGTNGGRSDSALAAPVSFAGNAEIGVYCTLDGGGVSIQDANIDAIRVGTLGTGDFF